MTKRHYLLALAALTQSVPFFANNEAPVFSKFELVRGIVVVAAELEGKPANFILDTGSPTMILNEQVQVADFQSNGAKENLSGNWTIIREFAWAGVRKHDLKALTADIAVLEKIAGKPIAGLIGYGFLEDFDLVLDFENFRASLLPHGEVARLEGWSLRSQFPLKMEGHLPVVEARIGNVLLRLGLDTGANTNLLSLEKASLLDRKLVTPIGNAGVFGFGLCAANNFAADVVKTTVGGKNYSNMRFVFSDISHFQNLVENNVDGLLGYPFFESGKFTINFSDGIIALWE